MTSVEKAPGPRAWDRLPEEGDEAWAAFITYRDMDYRRRRLTRAAEELGRTIQQVSAWNVKHRWRERVGAYDASIGEEIRQLRIQQAALVWEEHLQEARQMRELGVQAMALLDPYQLSKQPNEARLYLLEAQKVERELLGITDPEEQARGNVVVILDSGTVPGRTTRPEDLRRVVDADPEP